MKFLLPLVAVSVLLFAGIAWSEEEDAHAAELADLREQGRRLLEQGAVDYERLQQELGKVEDAKAAMGSRGTLAERDAMARQAETLRAHITELKKARSNLEQAKSYLNRGRFDAAKMAFNEAAARWSEVHQRIVAHLGPVPAVRRIPAAAGSAPRPTGGGELEALRKEVGALRAEIQGLRGEIRELKGLIQALAR